MAYTSAESGSPQVYVREVARDGEPGPGKWQISHDMGGAPKWRPDGKELYFRGRVDQIMAVDVKTDGPVFHAGTPRPLGWDPGTSLEFLVAASRDGQRFLIDSPIRQAEPLRVLVNWLP